MRPITSRRDGPGSVVDSDVPRGSIPFLRADNLANVTCCRAPDGRAKAVEHAWSRVAPPDSMAHPGEVAPLG